jgi:hypothetical protein
VCQVVLHDDLAEEDQKCAGWRSMVAIIGDRTLDK